MGNSGCGPPETTIALRIKPPDFTIRWIGYIQIAFIIKGHLRKQRYGFVSRGNAKELNCTILCHTFERSEVLVSVIDHVQCAIGSDYQRPTSRQRTVSSDHGHQLSLQVRLQDCTR